MDSSVFDSVVALCKRRGFVFPSCEIYGGLANTYDYGPLGAALLRNIRHIFWRYFIEQRSDMVGLDTSIILHPRVWEASGHVDSFSDAMIDCKFCRHRTRADHLIESYFEDKGESIKVEGKTVSELNDLIVQHVIVCPHCQQFDWTPVRAFNLLFETKIGIVPDDQSKVYLRGETAQGIFVSFKQIMDSTRVTLPFGVGNIGKSFRNEITKGHFTWRTLEFEQAEIEYFFDPEKTPWEPLFEEWKQDMWTFATQKLGLREHNLRWRVHDDAERSFYSKRTEDLEYNTPFGGYKELWGIAYRTDYDLSQHEKFSGVDLKVVDPSTGRRFLPHVIEPAAGVTRFFLSLLFDAYREEGDAKRVYLQIAPHLAPYRVAVFPLVSNKQALIMYAKNLFTSLSHIFPTAWDDRGNIGKRYRAQDEIGTPFCVTVDYQTLEDDTVTLRYRDTMAQERVHVAELSDKISALVS